MVEAAAWAHGPHALAAASGRADCLSRGSLDLVEERLERLDVGVDLAVQGEALRRPEPGA